MSIALDSTDYIERTTATPTDQACTIAGWIYINSLPATNHGIFHLYKSGGAADMGGLRWDGATHTALRCGSSVAGGNIATDPTTATWIYVYLRMNGTNVQAGWKTIAESAFDANKQVSISQGSTQTSPIARVGGNAFYANSLDMYVYRLSMWSEFVSDANLLLAAATDLGYTTNINTHIPGTATGDPSRYADTSGNSRDWTPSGTISDGSNPSLGSSTKPAFYYAQL